MMCRVVRQIIYLSFLLLFYVIMRAGIFGIWQPVFLIPLAVAYSMFSSETAACLFAVFCGFMTDIASGYVFGSGTLPLMTVCVAASLLARNYIRVNMIGFMLITTAAILLFFSVSWLINIPVSIIPRAEVILTASVIPSAAATAIVSPAVYVFVSAAERVYGRKKDVRS